MTFAAESIALREIDQFSVEKSKLIPVLCIMTVETPSHGFSMMELDVRMFFFEFSLFWVHLHGGVTIAARKHAFSNRRRRDGKLLKSHGGRYKADRQKKSKYDCGNNFLHAYQKGGKKGD